MKQLPFIRQHVLGQYYYYQINQSTRIALENYNNYDQQFNWHDCFTRLDKLTIKATI